MPELTISSHAAATLIARLSAKKLSPLAEAARRHERAFVRVFLDAIAEAQDAIVLQDLIGVLSLGHPGTGAPLFVLQPIFDGLLEHTKLTQPHEPYVRTMEVRRKPTLQQVYHRALKSGAHVQAVKLDMVFDATAPEAVAWAEREAAKLVTHVTEQAREAIRTLVVEGFENGVAPVDTAKLIRASIGLTERDAGAVIARHLKLIDGGATVKQAEAAAERYAAKLTRSRALTIARTETMKAANEGQQQLWEQAREEGLLSATAQKVWITADPCPICEPLEGEVVGLDEDFSIEGPPAHPNCMCTVGLV